jgi:arsenate reductase-like glutaredoxin family protein
MIRIFGSKACENCQALIKAFHAAKVAYSYVDVNDDKNEALCDQFEIKKLPHIQIMSGRKVVIEKSGYIQPQAVLALNEAVKKQS